MLSYEDRPGMVGKIGSILGRHNVNIASMHVGRRTRRGGAIVVLLLDETVAPEVMEEVSKAVDADFARLIRLDAVSGAPPATRRDYRRAPQPFEPRPWGGYQTLEKGPGYQVKRLVVEPGHRFSLQKHRHRAEHWTVVAGSPKVTLNGRSRRAAAARVGDGAARGLASRGERRPRSGRHRRGPVRLVSG